MEHVTCARSNLSCLGELCRKGETYWTQLDKSGCLLIDKLRWISMGFHFDWTKREYRHGFKSEFPKELSELALSLVERLADLIDCCHLL